MSNKLDLSYCAGIIDGEGSITICKRKDRNSYFGSIAVAMCDDRAVRLLHKTFGGSFNKIKYDPPARNQYAWQVVALQARRCAEALRPYLRIKYAQAANLIELQRLNLVIQEDTRLQRGRRSGPKRFHGAYDKDPELMTQCEDLYSYNKTLNKRGAEVIN